MPTEETPIVSMAQFADAFDISYDDADPVANRAVTLEQARRFVQSSDSAEQILPDGYTQIEYVESTGTQYINLGFGFQGSDDVEIDFQMTQAPTSAEGIFGGRDTGSARGYMLYAEARTNGFVFMYNNTYVTNLSSDWHGRHVFKKVGSNIYFDGVANSQTVSASFTQTRTAYLFSWHNESKQAVNSKTKIYSFSITRSGSLYSQCIPAKRNSDGVVGMYDIVRNVFRTNAISGSFTSGETVTLDVDKFPQDFTKLEYIESNGAQAFDTEYNPNSDTRVVLDYNLTQLTGKWMGIFAARDLNGYANQYAYWSNETGVYRSNYSGETGILFGSQNTNRHIIDKNKAILKEDGIVVASHPAATFSCGCSLHIFCGNTGGTKEHYAYMKLYSCKIYNDDVLIRDYVPVKRNRDSSVGLYDKVTRKFKASATNTNFIGGNVLEDSVPDVSDKILTLTQLKLLKSMKKKYNLLEYIHFDGGTFIDTGYYPNYYTQVQMKATFEKNSSYSGNNWIFGGRTNNSNAQYALLRASSTKFRWDFSTGQKSITVSTTLGDFVIETNGQDCYINGTKYSAGAISGAFTSTHTMRIASHYNTSSSDSNHNDLRRFVGNLYYFKISDNSGPIRDYVPVKRISDGAIGLYDKVNGLFYENNGTGTFGAGPEVGYV